MNTIKIELYKRETKYLPERATEGSIGYDVKARLDQSILLDPNDTIKIPLGFKLDLPTGLYCIVGSKSSWALGKAQHSGGSSYIDTDYTGEVHAILHNHTKFPIIINDGDTVAQILFQKKVPVEFSVGTVSKVTKRGKNGFGSTSKTYKSILIEE